MLAIYDTETARETILRRQHSVTADYPAALLESIADRFGEALSPQQAVSRIVASVREEGDAAVRRWSETLDDYASPRLLIGAERLARAAEALGPELLQALHFARERIQAFHQQQPLPSWTTGELGGRLGHSVTPIRRVGVYVPGGTAPLPSSLLMSVIPAQVAGVEEIVVCSPPIPDVSILAAARVCGLEKVYQVGGAQAIAAMAYGTERIPKVDKIVGPGNLFVTLAKQQVYGVVGLDGLAGPTETMIIADEEADPAWVAADLLAQAEHDPLAAAILLTPSSDLAKAVQLQASSQMEALSRSEIIAQSLRQRGGIVLTPDLETATRLADEYAPEHLCLVVAEPERLAAEIHNAGALFLGAGSYEVLGDYIAGPSHVLPTGGTARFASALNVLDFVKITAVIAMDLASSQSLSPYAARLAEAETLTAHAAAARMRMEAQDV